MFPLIAPGFTPVDKKPNDNERNAHIPLPPRVLLHIDSRHNICAGSLPAFLFHSAPRGTVFTDGSPEFAFIACHGSHASLIYTHLSCAFSRSLSPQCSRDKSPVYLLSASEDRRGESSTERAKRRYKSSGTREKKREKAEEKKEREGRGGYHSFFLRKRGPPTYLSTSTRSHLFFAVTPALPQSLTSPSIRRPG